VQQLDNIGQHAAGSSIVHTAKNWRNWQEETYLIQLWDKQGRLHDAATAASSDLSAMIPLQPQAGFYRWQLDNQLWRIYRADGAHLIVQIAQPEAARSGVIKETSVRILLPLTLQIPLLVFCAWIAVGRGLLPLNQLSQAIAQRQPDALTPLNALSLPVDLQPLAHTLNALLERLDNALQQQRNFVADAAHELRTPLAALQLQLDLLRRADTPNDRAFTLVALSKGIQRATHLVQQLLQIARSETSFVDNIHADVQLHRVAAQAIERHLPAARARDIDLGHILDQPTTTSHQQQ